MSRRARRLGWAARVVAFCPDSRSPGEEAGSQTRTLARSAPGGLGAPRRRLATRTRARLEGAGRRSPHAPLQPSTPALPLPPSAPGPRRWPRRPAYTHPWRALSARPRARGSPGVSGNREKGHKAKEGAKRRRGRSRGQGPADSPGGGAGGADTESAGKAPGVARGLQAHPPLAAPLPSPSRAPGALSVQLLSPPLGPSPLRRGAQSRGLRERREGKREGKGRGGGERRTIPPKAGVEFQLRTLGPNCTPPPGSSSPSAAARRRGEPPGGLVRSLPGAFLSPSRPRSPPPAPRLSASLSLAPHLSFPWEGARSFRLSGVLRGACLLPWQGLRRGLGLDTDSSPGGKT